LTELYLQQNQIAKIENLLPGLQTLDLAYNKLTSIAGLRANSALTELWLNMN